MRAALLAACAVVLAACTTLPPARPVASSAPSRGSAGGESAGSALPESSRTAASRDPRAASPGSNETGAEIDGSRAASNVLLERSRAARQAGSYDAAEASIERALRIAPNDPSLWLELAEIKLATGDTAQAASMARKAASLAGGDRAIAARAERLIGDAGR